MIDTNERNTMTTKPNDGGPAYPMHVPAHSGFGPHEHPGMTLRDHFAGLAMQGMFYHPALWDNSPGTHAQNAYAYADSMLAEREKGGAA